MYRIPQKNYILKDNRHNVKKFFFFEKYNVKKSYSIIITKKDSVVFKQYVWYHRFTFEGLSTSWPTQCLAVLELHSYSIIFEHFHETLLGPHIFEPKFALNPFSVLHNQRRIREWLETGVGRSCTSSENCSSHPTEAKNLFMWDMKGWSWLFDQVYESPSSGKSENSTIATVNLSQQVHQETESH